MERSVSPHGSEHSQYSTSNMSRSYASPGPMHTMHMPNPMQTQMSLPPFPEMPGMGNVPNMGMQQMHHQEPHVHVHMPPKSYPCGTCSKRFARRSDLARHERIHSGDKPHLCDICGKTFIQRSALTVHHRVHTGEKPHHCETCDKPFSDSSSLARHRRIHSGKRPYKCPYVNCQKTFTRRTTLTRHQNHHTGTVEEAAAALAASKAKGASQARSEGDHLSIHGSPMTTPSPAQRTMSMSPSMDMSGRHGGDLPYMQQNGSLPVHLRVGSPISTGTNGYSTGIRPTSHPTGYGPPSTLEPSLDHQSGPTSGGNSPHMSSAGWQSPAHVPSPSHHAANYVYPDPANGYPPDATMNQMYYTPGQPMRRPQSTEPGMGHMA